MSDNRQDFVSGDFGRMEEQSPLLPPEKTDSEKIELIAQQVAWLCGTLSGMMQAMSTNPMFKMMMRKAGS